MAAPANSTILSYLDLPPFCGAYDDVLDTTLEDKVGKMWMAILIHAFPIDENYAISCQQRADGGFTDITVSHYFQNQYGAWIEKPFLVVETKRRGGPGRVTAMEGYKHQLQQYLRDISDDIVEGEAAEVGVPGIYGILAYGRKAEFFKFDEDRWEMVPMFHSKKAYHVREDLQAILRRLNNVKNNH